MKRIIFFLSVSALLALLFPTNVYAQEDKFEIKYDVNYTVSENGITNVVQNITLKNKTDDFRPSEYSLELGLLELTNIQASDPLGNLAPKIEKNEGKTKITLSFNQIVVGKDKTLPFKISFETGELVKKKGLIWEVNVPGLEDKTGFAEYKVNLSVPESFGKPAFIKPTKSLTGGKLSWTKEEIPKGGMTVAFGEFQIYNFNLKYHLKNPRLYPVQTEIALPPQTNYQKVLIKTISPKPLNVRIDEDGNWLASYQLRPTISLEIEVKGTAQVFLNPQDFISQKLKEEERQIYLSPQKYWEVGSREVEDVARTLQTPTNIYNFVVQELTYDLKRVEGKLERIGARDVLKNKNSAICMEFTDLFIALARSAGIPAREINGFAWAENSSLRPISLIKDVLHAWPEYYNQEKNQWIMVDPTWGNTTGGLDYFNVLDFDHFSFVIKGRNSEYPIPAGGYKTSSTTQAKDVEVSFGKIEDFKFDSEIKVDLVIPQKVFPLFPVQGELIIENKGNSLLFSQMIKIVSDDLSPSLQYFKTKDLPPLGKQTIPVSFSKTSLLTNKKAIIRLEGPNTLEDFEILISFLTILDKRFIAAVGGGILGGVIIVFVAARRRRLSLQRQKEEDSLHWQSK